MNYDMIIVGAGTAGLTAGIYALRSGIKPLILECEVMGGQITLSPCVENYPGIAKISGMEFADGLMAQLSDLGSEVTYGKVISSRKTQNGFEVRTEDGEIYEGKILVIASGAAHRHLGIAREEDLIGKGVSYCAVCDGPFFRGKTAAVVGGGSAALQDALYLAGICSKVYLIHRRDTFRAEKSLVNQVANTANIECVMESRVTALVGEHKLEALEVTSATNTTNTANATNTANTANAAGDKQMLEIDGLFVAIGMEPHNEAFEELVELDDAGYIIAGEDCKTKTPGVYAAGDCRTKAVRQLTTAAADGTVCGLAAH